MTHVQAAQRCVGNAHMWILSASIYFNNALHYDQLRSGNIKNAVFDIKRVARLLSNYVYSQQTAMERDVVVNFHDSDAG